MACYPIRMSASMDPTACFNLKPANSNINPEITKCIKGRHLQSLEAIQKNIRLLAPQKQQAQQDFHKILFIIQTMKR